MPNQSALRFQFIAHALAGTGPFRPVVSVGVAPNGGTVPTATVGDSALIPYPRESTLKFARRNQVAFYASPLARACARFAGFLSSRAPTRDLPNDLYSVVADDVDGKGNAIDVFLNEFAMHAKARGSHLLLVDAPPEMAETQSQAQQIADRRVPYWVQVFPEAVGEYQLGDDGKFDFVEFEGNYTDPGTGERTPCTWRFDRMGWQATDREKRVLDADAHGLGECPVLIFTEAGDFPHFGPFAAIADIAKRLFNLDSELDEILRSQTFSLLTMQVPDNSGDQQKLDAAKVAGETIGTQNLMVHTGSTPSFIAPPDGPAQVYLKRIDQLRDLIDEIAMAPTGSAARESGLALQMRFQQLNADLAHFASRMEDLERRAWELTRRWLGLSAEAQTTWPRDFNVADIELELRILSEMQASGLPPEVIAEQQKRIVALQFSGLGVERLQEIVEAIEERTLQPGPGAGGEGNVIPLRPDPNAALRDAIAQRLGAGNGA